MELKRALLAIQSMGLSDSPKVEAKSSEVVSSIQALLGEFGGSEITVGGVPAQVPVGEIKVQEAQDLIELPTVEQISEEHAPVIEEHTPVIEEHTEEAANDVVAGQESFPQNSEETEEPVVESAEPENEEEGEDDEDEDEDEDDDDE